jgi:hypothetical protein
LPHAEIVLAIPDETWITGNGFFNNHRRGIMQRTRDFDFVGQRAHQRNANPRPYASACVRMMNKEQRWMRAQIEKGFSWILNPSCQKAENLLTRLFPGGGV